jgi:hypothetical protein
MKPQFSLYPGAQERQLIRCADNPLFPPQRRHVIQVEVNDAQRRDANEAVAFQSTFRALVQRAIELSPQEDSEVILKLKEDLDRAYEQSCGLPGDSSDIKAALKKLLDIVMRAVWSGAADDPAAQANLREEEEARAIHFQMLEEVLVADMIRPDSPIGPDELAATLLSESESAVAAATDLFDDNQLASICRSGGELLQSLPASAVPESARARLALMERRLRLRQLGV